MPLERTYRALHHFSLFLTLCFQLNGFIYCYAMLFRLCLPCTHAQHLETGPVGGLARLNYYYMKASQPGCRASPVGVKRAGPVSGLARFHVIIPFAFVMFTLLGGLARLSSQPGYWASSPPCYQGLRHCGLRPRQVVPFLRSI